MQHPPNEFLLVESVLRIAFDKRLKDKEGGRWIVSYCLAILLVA